MRGDKERRRKEREKGAPAGFKIRIPPNNSVAHGLDMRHRIVFSIFLNFFDFAGKFLLFKITFFHFEF